MDPLIFSTTLDPQMVRDALHAKLTELGFTVAADPEGWSGTAEVGSALGRALGGGFVRRMKLTWSVATGAAPGTTVLTVAPAMSGYGGGAMGRSKAKKEMDAIGGALASVLPPA